jgi:two-component system cell cycle sensor histidine kinase/response regulator CckA
MESAPHPHVPERTRKLEDGNESRRPSERDATRLLQEAAAHLIHIREVDGLCERIFDAAMGILSCDFASLRTFDAERGGDGELGLAGQRGFSAEAVTRWQRVHTAAWPSYGEALDTGRTVWAPDVRNCVFLRGSEELEEYLGAGIQAFQSTPLVATSGALVGMVSTHWREPHEPSAGELDALDILARMTADWMERWRCEEALRESEERFRSIADTVPVMIWAASPDKQGVFFNKCCLDFTGRTVEEKQGDGWVTGLHPEDRDQHLRVFSSSIDARQPFRTVFRLRRGDGEYQWVQCSGVPRFSPGGGFLGAIGACTEISSQKEIEEGLRASEVRLNAALRLAKVGSWERQIDGRAIHWSAELLRILGLAGGVPANLAAFLSHVHPKDREKVLDADAEVRSSSEPIDMEYRTVRPDGEVRFVRSVIEAVRDAQGVALRITEAIQDVTDQVRARELLRESEQHLKRAERLAQVGHWQWDLRANRVTGSDEMFRIFGKPPDHIPTYEGFLKDLSPTDRERLERLIGDSLAKKTGHSMEYQIVHPNGDVRTISCIWEVLLDEDESPVRVFGTCQDITESRMAQQASFARQKLETVGTLASGIAHDFNNLLGGVLAQAELAMADNGTESFPQTELAAISSLAIRGSEIVRQLMIYATREEEAMGLVDVSQVVREMVELLRVTVSKRAVLEMDLDQDLPAVRANPAQLRQIVMNLVANASDAIGERDGTILLTTTCVKASRASHGGGLNDGSYLKLEVSDTGRGMPPEAQAKAFDPFFTTKAAGHGLGLAVVQGIVQSLSGSVLLTSEPGKGTRIQILLPCAMTTAGATRKAKSGGEAAAGPAQYATLLVVEDEASLRDAVGKLLRRAGFHILEAADGSAAIELLRAKGAGIDAMLLDMTIPGASSPEVVAEAVKARPDIRVILTSAHSQEVITGVMSVPQVRSFIRKPFRFGDLVQALREALAPEAKTAAVAERHNGSVYQDDALIP